MNEIDERLRELRRALRGLSRRRRRRALDEARDHLLCAVDDGLSPREAVARLGRPEQAFAGFPARRPTHRLALIAVPVVMLALVPSVGGTLQRLGAGTTPSRAAAPPLTPANAQKQNQQAVVRCIATWNGPAGARWRAIAERAGIQRAYVGVGWASRPAGGGKPAIPMHISGCAVGLQGTPVASPYQPRTYVYAKPVGRGFRFYRVRHIRTRAVAQTTNARLDDRGRITLSMHQLPRPCPTGPIGSGIEHVQTATGAELAARATTQLSASVTQSFDVVIRNQGGVAIRGAIASIEVSGVAQPRRLWWRSGPRVISRLAAGASTTVRIKTDLVGHGVRLLRVTTAAIECESRLGDNSPVFRVRVG
jgi:hypothetical protein